MSISDRNLKHGTDFAIKKAEELVVQLTFLHHFESASIVASATCLYMQMMARIVAAHSRGDFSKAVLHWRALNDQLQTPEGDRLCSNMILQFCNTIKTETCDDLSE